MSPSEYEIWCRKKISTLESQMNAIVDKKSPLWRKLNMQRLAQQARLRTKMAKNNLKTGHQLLDDIIDFLVREVKNALSPSKRENFERDLRSLKFLHHGRLSRQKYGE